MLRFFVLVTAATASSTKLDELDVLYHRVAGNSTPAEGVDVRLAPLEGILLDAAILGYLDAPKAERLNRERIVGKMVSQYSTPLMTAVFERRAGFLRAEARTGLQARLEVRTTDLTAAEQRLTELRSRLAEAEAAAAWLTARVEALEQRFGRVSAAMLQLRDRMSFSIFQPPPWFRSLQSHLESLVVNLATRPESEIPHRQANILHFLHERKSMGMNDNTLWWLCHNPYMTHMAQPALHDEARRVELLDIHLRNGVDEQERVVESITADIRRVSDQISLLL